MRGSESRDATSAHFVALIGDRPLEELKALNLKPYCVLWRATIKFPAKARKGSEDEKGGAECYINGGLRYTHYTEMAKQTRGRRLALCSSLLP